MFQSFRSPSRDILHYLGLEERFPIQLLSRERLRYASIIDWSGQISGMYGEVLHHQRSMGIHCRLERHQALVRRSDSSQD